MGSVQEERYEVNKWITLEIIQIHLIEAEKER